MLMIMYAFLKRVDRRILSEAPIVLLQYSLFI